VFVLYDMGKNLLHDQYAYPISKRQLEQKHEQLNRKQNNEDTIMVTEFILYEIRCVISMPLIFTVKQTWWTRNCCAK